MRISDWSSDVCSSDLIGPRPVGGAQADGAPLPSREYSLASVPGDGSLQLLVRRMFHSDGRPGLGRGWLVDGVQPGGLVDLRVGANPDSPVPAHERPFLLEIGRDAGGGMAWQEVQ